MTSKIIVLGWVPHGTGSVAPFDQVFTRGERIDFHNIVNIKGLSALIIWGGADISPTIYNEPVSSYTGARAELSARDKLEKAACEEAIKHGVPIIGICRGAQLVCALAGGKLIQHVDGHTGGDHGIITKDGRHYVTSSVHHQMMYPWDVDHDMIAWATNQRSGRHIMGNNESIDVPVEPEIVFFPKINALAIQGHPEFMDKDDPFVEYCMELTRTYLFKEETSDVA